MSNFIDVEFNEVYNWLLKKGNVVIIVGDVDYFEEKIYLKWGYRVIVYGYVDGLSKLNFDGVGF